MALAAQGLADSRPSTPVKAMHIRRLIDRLGVVQIDSVNVLVRTHYLPAFSRLGDYSRASIWKPRPGAGGRRCSNTGGTRPRFLPIARQPLFRWRMRRAREGETWGGLARFAKGNGGPTSRRPLQRIEREAPLTGGDFAEAKREAGWWNWSDGKRALEWLFWAGYITTRTRRGFERVYDLTSSASYPPSIINAPTPTEPEAHRELLRIAARALGVATEMDLRDYFRMPVAADPRPPRRAGRSGRSGTGERRGLGEGRVPRP